MNEDLLDMGKALDALAAAKGKTAKPSWKEALLNLICDLAAATVMVLITQRVLRDGLPHIGLASINATFWQAWAFRFVTAAATGMSIKSKMDDDTVKPYHGLLGAVSVYLVVYAIL